MRHMFICGLMLHLALQVLGQSICPPAIDWQHSYGTAAAEQLRAGQQAIDGGFVFGGDRASTSVPADFWLIRVNTNGSILWDRTYGGDYIDELSAVQQTPDGGFILGGTSLSDAGTNKTSPHFGEGDFWIVRTDANGAKLWDQSYGGDESDRLTTLAVLPDGGCVAGGFSRSGSGTGNKTSEYFGDLDIWLLRLDPQGNKLWERSFGGSGADLLAKVKPTVDGGFILVGNSDGSTNGNKTTPSFGGPDVWVIRLDTNGVPVWQRSLGGTSNDIGRDVIELTDGTFFIGASSSSMYSSATGKQSGSFGSNDFWLIYLDADGTHFWDLTYGGPVDDQLQSLAVTDTGELLLAGSSTSPGGFGIKNSPLHGERDYWVVAVNAFGSIKWEQSFGGEEIDQAQVALYGQGNTLLLAGSSQSHPGGNKTAADFGDFDFWVMQLRPETPGDCDGDGVIDEQDLCPATPVHSVVDGSGCSVTEACPCERPWASNADRVNCIEQVSAALVHGGLITEAQRDALIFEAMQTNCPPPGMPVESIISFGFTNIALGQAALMTEAGGDFGSSGALDNLPVHAVNLGFTGQDGMAVMLGRSQSGLFFYPDAPVPWGIFDPANFMLGKAYGQLNGADGRLLSAVRAAKTYYEYYPVNIDLSPLEPTSLTIQVLTDNNVSAETTVTAPVTRVVVHSSITVGPRYNPFWRMPDGTVGALIEFTEFLGHPNPGEYGLSGIEIPGHDEPFQGNRVFIRANNPGNVVDFVSRFEVYGGGGLPSFSMVDGRFPFGGFANKISGPSVFGPSNGTLTVQRFLGGSGNTNSHGVIVELTRALRFSMEMAPLTPGSNESVQVFATGTISCVDDDENPYDCSVTEPVVRLLHRETHLEVTGYLGNATNALIKVYRYGLLSGQAVVPPDVLGAIPLFSNSAPLVNWSVAAGGSNAPASMLLSFEQPITFMPTGGSELVGDLVRVIPGTSNRLHSLTHVSLQTGHKAFTITSERTNLVAPALAITSVGTNVAVSWPRPHEPFVLESAPSLTGTFTPVADGPVLDDGILALQLPLHGDTTRFFRLRRNHD